ncbi:Hypothetical protein POVR1_LOCUS214 [uncultured virus]|nr:Hypothetical protein POVR1_LOCUS214 [uncultured virus]
METQQIPKDFTERVCGLACWASQAFEHDLSPEDKAIFLEAAKKAFEKGMILKFAFFDDDADFDGPLMGRNGFHQIFDNLAQHLKSADDFKCRLLNDSAGKWKVVFHTGPADDSEMDAKVQIIRQRADQPFVVHAISETGKKSCAFVLSFNQHLMPIGSQ